MYAGHIYGDIKSYLDNRKQRASQCLQGAEQGNKPAQKWGNGHWNVQYLLRQKDSISGSVGFFSCKGILWPNHWTIESQIHRIITWKGPLRSSSPTVTPTPPCLVNHVLKCQVYTFFEHLSGLSSPETLEALKSFENRSDDVVLTIFPKTAMSYLLDEKSTAAAQKCVTAHDPAITPTTG